MNFLIDCKDILSYYNKKINKKTKIIDLQPRSKLYNQIQKDSNINPNILNNHISIIFFNRKKNLIKLKPINFIFNSSTKNIIKLILNRYRKIIETDVKIITHLDKIISDNLKHYRENFYI